MSEQYLQPEVHLVTTMVPGVDGISSPARLTQIEADLATMSARPAIYVLDDIPDVDLTGAAGGNALVYDAVAEEWIPGGIQEGIRVRDPGAILVENAKDLTFYQGLTAVYSTSSSRVYARPLYGTDAQTVAEGNHPHELPTIYRYDIAPTGYMSGGTRILYEAFPTLAAKRYRVTAKLRMQIRGADPGAAYFQVGVTVDSSTRTSPAGVNGLWAVQGVPRDVTWEHSFAVDGTGSAIRVAASISYHSGAGINVDFGELEVVRIPER